MAPATTQTTTIAVSVTLKIDAYGSTPDELVTFATLSALGVIEEGLTAKFGEPDGHDRYRWADRSPGPAFVSVKGATALVNSKALERLFVEN